MKSGREKRNTHIWAFYIRYRVEEAPDGEEGQVLVWVSAHLSRSSYEGCALSGCSGFGRQRCSLRVGAKRVKSQEAHSREAEVGVRAPVWGICEATR